MESSIDIALYLDVIKYNLIDHTSVYSNRFSMGYVDHPPSLKRTASITWSKVSSNVLKHMRSQFCDFHFLGYEGFCSQFLSIFN